jgi:hypothetical protein
VIIHNNSYKITSDNFKTVRIFIKVIQRFADGIFLTGSNAWGAFYAPTYKSDIDLVVISKSAEQFKKIIHELVSKGLINSVEIERFSIYNKLYRAKLVDSFSIRVCYKNKWISLDFIPLKIVQLISKLKEIRTLKIRNRGDIVKIRVINEFRSNSPKLRGYSLDGFNIRRKIKYFPIFEKVISKDGVELGYISQSLVDANVSKNGKAFYFLGVFSFFFAIFPIILFDKYHQIEKIAETLRSNIINMINHKSIKYITRQERMSASVLKIVKRSFLID